MAGIEHITGQGTFWTDEEEHIMLWNRLEFRKKKNWVEVRVSSMEEGGKSEVVSSRIPLVVLFVGWIMAVIIETGGADVERVLKAPSECPPECEDGYIRLEDGNLERCWVCGGSD